MRGFSQAADNNKAAILEVLAEQLHRQARLIEIGSGAGQHAIYMAATLNHVLWQPTDVATVLPMLTSNISKYGAANILSPTALDLATQAWPVQTYDCIYSANVMHIVSTELGENLIRGAAKMLTADGMLAIYGPFKYEGNFTSSSNADFDLWLKARDEQSGIRDFEWVHDLAARSGLQLLLDQRMPANNQTLIFKVSAK